MKDDLKVMLLGDLLQTMFIAGVLTAFNNDVTREDLGDSLFMLIQLKAICDKCHIDYSALEQPIGVNWK